MYLGKIFLSESNRVRLSQVLCALYFVNLLISITILAFGAHMKVSILKLKHIYSGYDDDTLPYMFIGVGLISIVAKILTGLTCFASQSYNSRQKVSVILRILCIVNLGLGVTLLVAAIMCFAHTKHLSDAFDRGLRQSMAEYAYNPKIKTELDELQMGYKCCGNKGHEDWFNIGWILDKFHEPLPDLERKQHILPQSYFRYRRETAPELEGPASSQDSVPFSCCDPKAIRPCVHRDITNKLKHALYDYTSHTLYKKGCNEVIMDYLGGTILTAGGVFAVTTFFIELFLVVMTRYLQTSIQVAINKGFYDLTAPGYLIDCICIVEHNPQDMQSLYQPITEQVTPPPVLAPSYLNSPIPDISYSSAPGDDQTHQAQQPPAQDTYHEQPSFRMPSEPYHPAPSYSAPKQKSYRNTQSMEQPFQLAPEPSYGYQPSYNNQANYEKHPSFGNHQSYGSYGEDPSYEQQPSFGNYQSYASYAEQPSFGNQQSYGSYGNQQSYGSLGEQPSYGNQASNDFYPNLSVEHTEMFDHSDDWTDPGFGTDEFNDSIPQEGMSQEITSYQQSFTDDIDGTAGFATEPYYDEEGQEYGVMSPEQQFEEGYYDSEGNLVYPDLPPMESQQYSEGQVFGESDQMVGEFGESDQMLEQQGESDEMVGQFGESDHMFDETEQMEPSGQYAESDMMVAASEEMLGDEQAGSMQMLPGDSWTHGEAADEYLESEFAPNYDEYG